MITHPALPLQKAIIDALKDHEGVTAIVGPRIYDHVPDNAQFPYVAMTGDAYTRDLWQHDCFVTVSCFTGGKGRPAVKRLAEQVIDALDRQIIVRGFDTDEGAYEDMDIQSEAQDAFQVADVNFAYVLSAEEDLFGE